MTGDASADPWALLRSVLGDPLHPGGYEATADLLDRAGVGAETVMLDIGCGAGGALEVARDRGCRAVGLDRNPTPAEGPQLRGDMSTLPVADGCVDVVLAECVLCLSSDRQRALSEVARVLAPGGRLALSDVVVETDLSLPPSITGALCLDADRGRATLLASLESAGFTVETVRDHHDDLVAMRDRAARRVDYHGLLSAMGERGRRLSDGIERLEAAIESEDLSYVSTVCRV